MHFDAGSQFAAAAFRITGLLLDTCSVINIAAHRDAIGIVENLEQALDAGSNTLLVPDVVAEEFNARRELTIIQRSENRIAQIQGMRIMRDLYPDPSLFDTFIETLKRTAEDDRDTASIAVDRVSKLLARGTPSVQILPSSDRYFASAAKRIRAHSRPGQPGRNFERSAINDHVIWLHVIEQAAMGPLLFCTDNHADFCDREHDQLGTALRDELGPNPERVDFHNLDSLLRAHRDGSSFIARLATSCPHCGVEGQLSREILREVRASSYEFYRCSACNGSYPSGRLRVMR